MYVGRLAAPLELVENWKFAGHTSTARKGAKLSTKTPNTRKLHCHAWNMIVSLGLNAPVGCAKGKPLVVKISDKMLMLSLFDK